MDNNRPIRKVKLKVEPSLNPEKEKTHILVLESETEHGWNYERIFKGRRRECLELKKKMEEKNG